MPPKFRPRSTVGMKQEKAEDVGRAATDEKVRRLDSFASLARTFNRQKSASNLGAQWSEPTNTSSVSAKKSSPHTSTGPPSSHRTFLPRSTTVSNIAEASSRSPLKSSQSGTNTPGFPSRIPTPANKRSRRLSLVTAEEPANPPPIKKSIPRKPIARHLLQTHVRNRPANNETLNNLQDAVLSESPQTKESFPAKVLKVPTQFKQKENSIHPGKLLRATVSTEASISSPTYNNYRQGHDIEARRKRCPSESSELGNREPDRTRAGNRQSAYGVLHHQLLRPIEPPVNQLTPYPVTPSVDRTGTKRNSLAGHSAAQEQSSSGGIASKLRSSLRALSDSLSGGSRSTSYSRLHEDSPSPCQQVVQDLRQVNEHKPSKYWSGRFVALNDSLMNEACNLPEPKACDDLKAMHTFEALRANEVFVILEGYCTTPAARKSLNEFKVAFAIVKRMPELLSAQSWLKGADVAVATSTGSWKDRGGEVAHKSLQPKQSKAQSLLHQSSFGSQPLHSHRSYENLLSPATPKSHETKGRKSSFMERLVQKGRRTSESKTLK